MIDIDHPAIQVGVGALFGQHPERGGQERMQAVFTVLNAVIDAGYLMQPPDSYTELRQSGPIVVGADEQLAEIRAELIHAQQKGLYAQRAIEACDHLIEMAKRTPEFIKPSDAYQKVCKRDDLDLSKMPRSEDA